MPARWCDETGLPEAVFAPIARGVAAILRHGVMLLQLPALDPVAQEEAIAKMVADTSRFGPEAIGLLAAVMLARRPGSARVLAALPRQAAEGVVGRMLDGLGDGLAQPPSRQSVSLAQDAADTARLAATLDALEDRTSRSDLRRRVQQIRRDAEAACRERFSHAVGSELPRRLAEVSPGAGDVEVAALETMARDVRRLEQAGRRLGGGSAYDAVLSGTSALLAGPAGEVLTLADRVRLAEILLGPEAALELLRS